MIDGSEAKSRDLDEGRCLAMSSVGSSRASTRSSSVGDGSSSIIAAAAAAAGHIPSLIYILTASRQKRGVHVKHGSSSSTG